MKTDYKSIELKPILKSGLDFLMFFKNMPHIYTLVDSLYNIGWTEKTILILALKLKESY